MYSTLNVFVLAYRVCTVAAGQISSVDQIGATLLLLDPDYVAIRSGSVELILNRVATSGLGWAEPEPELGEDSIIFRCG